jgi:hypothetical protein
MNPEQSMQKRKKSSALAGADRFNLKRYRRGFSNCERACWFSNRQHRAPSVVTTGLDPVVHADVPRSKHRLFDAAQPHGLPGRRRAKATPFCERLCPAMTQRWRGGPQFASYLFVQRNKQRRPAY